MISINFIVILILALAVLGIGFNLSYRFLHKAETMKAHLDAQTEAQIESYLAAGEIVTIPITKKMISDGGAVFGLGVLNVYDTTKEFSLKFTDVAKYNIDGGIDTTFSSDDYKITTTLSPPPYPFNLDPYNDKKIAILVQLTNPTIGLYAFKVQVYNSTDQISSNEYGDPQVIYVEVP